VQLLALPGRDLVGVALADILTAPLYETIEAGLGWHGEIDIVRLDGRRVPVEASLSPGERSDFACWTFRDISERRRLAKLQEEFLSMAAHELKTPLTSLKGFAQLVQRGVAGKRAADVIVQQVDHLDLLVADLLDAARLESGRIVIHPVDTDLSSVIGRAVEQAQMLTSSHTIECDLPKHPVMGNWDPHRLQQVMRNLLSNALKYAPSSPRITIRVVESDDWVRTTVRDFGPGITPAAMPHLFKRFYRVDDPTGKGIDGMGLGLYISRIIVEGHGGTIQVASQLEEGCAFTFNLPRAATGSAARSG
jgi:signal transduction histidine kinase